MPAGEKNPIVLDAGSRISISSDFQYVIVRDKNGGPVPPIYPIADCTFDKLSFEEYVNRKKDTKSDGSPSDDCLKAQKALEGAMKTYYGENYKDDLISLLKKEYGLSQKDSEAMFERQYPMLHGRCYTGMGRIPAGDWMCSQDDCSAGLNKKAGEPFTSKDGTKTCVILDNAPLAIPDKGKSLVGATM